MGDMVPVCHSTRSGGKLEVDATHNQSKYDHHQSLHEDNNRVTAWNWVLNTSLELDYWNGADLHNDC